MNHALLSELQRVSAYPSVTVLVNTTAGVVPDTALRARTAQLIDVVDQRLRGDVVDEERAWLVTEIRRLVDDAATEPPATAMGLFVSPGHSVFVRLGRAVTERVVIDQSFATRDLVADLNRTAQYRLVTISDRMLRVLIGDRRRLVEVRNEAWPLLRTDELSVTGWSAAVVDGLRDLQRQHPLPTVVAGVERSVRRHHEALAPFRTIGVIPGNHDRTGWAELHTASWPLVTDWLRADLDDALRRLDAARSERRYAGGIHEIWPLAADGRVDVLVVEDTFAVAARVNADNQLDPVEDATAPDVVDDIVDEAIEAVLQAGGRVVVTGDGNLAAHDRIAAVLRY